MSKETIHSGHFMTSNPHTEIQGEEGDDEDVEVDVVDVEGGVVNQTAGDKSVTAARVGDESDRPVTYYKFGPHKAQSIAIDVSLNKLNKCIKVAYMKMTTPKWKDFKGLKLNNVIWRAYYMEFRKPDKKTRRMPFNFFSVPDEDTTHSKIEGSVLEGMYWKRRMEAVCAQYKRWRTYNRYAKRKLLRACCRKQESICACDTKAMQMPRPPQSQTPTGNSTFDNFDMDDDFDNEFTNQLFESLNAPFLFPNPKDGGKSVGSNSNDLSIYQQPGLLSLQPSIEEIMSMSTADYYFPEEAGNCMQQQETSQQAQRHPTLISTAQFEDDPNYEGMGTPPQMEERKPSSAAVPSSSPTAPSQSQNNNHHSYSTTTTDYTAKEYDVAMQLAGGFDTGGPAPQLQRSLYSAEQRPGVLSSSTAPIAARKHGTAGCAPSRLIPVQSASFFNSLSSVSSSSQQEDQYTTSVLLDHYMPRILAAVSGGVPTSTGLPLIGYSSRANLPHQQQTSVGNEWLLTNLQQHSQQQIQLQQQQYQPQQQAQQQPAQFIRPTDRFLAPRSVAPSSGIQTTTNHHRPSHERQRLALPQHQQPTAHPFSSPSTTTVRTSNPIGGIFPQEQQVQQRPRGASYSGNNTLVGADLSQYLPQPNLGNSISSGSAPAVSMASMMVPPSSSPFITGLPTAKSNYTQIPPRLNPVEAQQRLLAVASGQKITKPNPTSLQSCPPQAHAVQTVKSSQVFITRNPLTTSIAGPTAPSFINNIYSNSNKGKDPSISSLLPFFNKSVSPTYTGGGKLSSSFRFPPVDQTGVSPPLAIGVARPPTAPVFDSTSQAHFSPASLAQRRSTLQSPPQPPSCPVDSDPIVPKRAKKFSAGGVSVGAAGKVSTTTTSAASYTPLTPPLQYTEIGGNSTGGMGMGSPDAGAMDISSPLSGGGTSGTMPGTSNSSCSSSASMSGMQPPQLGGLTASELLLPLAAAGRVRVKEEEKEDSKPFKSSSTATGSAKRRHATMSGSSRASSRAAADSTLHPEERKRILHLHAEKNRRCALKDGFECLVDAVPAVEQAGVKSTNAVVLNRAAQHIRELREEAEEKMQQVEEMKKKIKRVNEKITTLQANLPSNNRLTTSSSGSSSSSKMPNMKCQLEQFFEHNAKDRARRDYRFWLMSEIFQKLLRSFAASIHADAANREEVLASARQWLERSWNSAALRPACTETLVRLATASGAINDDSSLPKYALSEIAKFSGNGSSSSSPPQ